MITIEDEIIDYSVFPNLEMLVHTGYLQDIRSNSTVSLHYYYSGNESILHLYFVLSYLKKQLNNVRVILTIPYMPFSRMDRSQNGSCFTLAHVVSLISSVLDSTDLVQIVEPHSSETINQFKSNGINVRDVYVVPNLANRILVAHPEIDLICYPDKGARDRYAFMEAKRPIIYCEKKRDFDSGKIVGLSVIGEESVEGKNILILDDLCSRGGTFFFAANNLRERGASAVYLAVCHLETTVVDGELVKPDSPINRVYATSTMINSNCLDQDKILVHDWRTLACIN